MYYHPVMKILYQCPSIMYVTVLLIILYLFFILFNIEHYSRYLSLLHCFVTNPVMHIHMYILYMSF